MNKNKRNNGVVTTWIVVAALSIALGGCSTYQYKRAEAPDAATVQLVNVSGSPVYARESHRGDCTDSWPFDNNGSGIPPNTSRSTPVLPGTFFVIVPTGKLNIGAESSMRSGFVITSCLVSVGFTVEANAFYEISYRDNAGSCALQARWKKDGGWQPLHLTKMKPNNIFVNPVSCKKAED